MPRERVIDYVASEDAKWMRSPLLSHQRMILPGFNGFRVWGEFRNLNEELTLKPG